MSKQEEYTPAEIDNRFVKILRGAMHKPTPLKDIPKKKKRKPAKASSSRSSRAT